jgi:hypothetical protein
MYILLGTDKDCDLLQDKPVLSPGKKPHDKQNHNCLDNNRNVGLDANGLSD